MKYYNQDTLNDQWVLEKMFPEQRGGFFFEAGAMSGKAGSSTYLLEKERGWKGILVEPISHLYEGLKRNRPNSICLQLCLTNSDTPEMVEFIEHPSLGMSAVKKYIDDWRQENVFNDDPSKNEPNYAFDPSVESYKHSMVEGKHTHPHSLE